ncbi:MAG: pilin [Patescibacteria group bacterium]
MAKKFSKIFLLTGLVFLIFSATPAFAQTSEASAQCWSKSDCMKKTTDCQACFELKTDVCGENRGFCYAKPVPATLEISLGGLSSVTDPAQYISTLYQWGVSITGILAGIMIMIGGLLYLTAGGSPERVSNAKDYISSALIGLILALTSYFLLQTVNPALLTLKFPKVPLVAPAVQFTQFCEDLEEAGIEVEPEGIGKTLCGDPGIPKPADENANVPSKCTYKRCISPGDGCLPCTDKDPLACTKTANCFPCAGTRIDGVLAQIKPGVLGNPSDVQAPRRAAGKEFCGAISMLDSPGVDYRCEFADTPTLLGQGVWESFKSFAGDFALGTGLTFSLMPIGGSLLGKIDTVGRAEEIGGAVTGRSGLGAAGQTTQYAATAVSIVKAGGAAAMIPVAGISAIGGGAYVALKEFFNVANTSVNPEKYFGVNGVCALVKLDCSKIKTCQDYENLSFDGQKNSTLKQIGFENFGTNGFLTDTIDLTRRYCIGDPCQLPLACAPTIQEENYWTPEGGRSDSIPSDPAEVNLDGRNIRCTPSEMVFSYTEHDKFSEMSPTGLSPTGKALINKYHIAPGKIYPVVRPFQAGTQRTGQFCLENKDCASGQCVGSGVTYKDVRIMLPEERAVWTVLQRDNPPLSLTFKRCN